MTSPLEDRIQEYLNHKFNPSKGQWVHLNAENYSENIMAIIKNYIDDEINEIKKPEEFNSYDMGWNMSLEKVMKELLK
jgi:hypothetical protein